MIVWVVVIALILAAAGLLLGERIGSFELIASGKEGGE
jgi:hypothetical protein